MAIIFRLAKNFNLILASASPRRRQLLETLGMPFAIHNCGASEHEPLAGDDPRQYCIRAALEKGRACAASLAGNQEKTAIIIAADTIVCLNGAILGKPRDFADALAMLENLCGQTHQAYTGVYLGWPENESRREDIFCEKSDVTFGSWDEDILKAYVSGGEPMDKAGAYAIQGEGGFLVDSLRGSWTNVVGLPMSAITRKLLASNLIAPYLDDF